MRNDKIVRLDKNYANNPLIEIRVKLKSSFRRLDLTLFKIFNFQFIFKLILFLAQKIAKTVYILVYFYKQSTIYKEFLIKLKFILRKVYLQISTNINRFNFAWTSPKTSLFNTNKFQLLIYFLSFFIGKNLQFCLFFHYL